jgi:hypothetical protein
MTPELINEEKVLTSILIDHNNTKYCMNKLELEHRLTVFVAEQPVDRFEISDSVEADRQVELTLKPNTPISERFIVRLETAIGQKIGSLSLFRVRRNVFIVRFTLERNFTEDSAADRIEELPAPYAYSPQKLAHARDHILIGMTRWADRCG